MKINKFFWEKIYLLGSIIFNIYIFLIHYLNYSSYRGTDFHLYGNYLDYFVFGQSKNLQSQTVGYFSLVSEMIKLNKSTLLISIDYKNLIINHGIQVVNYLFFVIGILGIYKLLRFIDISKFQSLTAINLVSIFPPLVGLRMILKPEILAFCFLPWLIYLILLYRKTYKTVFLVMLFPIISLLVSLKASITLMIGLTILLFFGKDTFRKEVIYLGVGSLLATSGLILESFQITNIFVWDHKTPPGYNFKAPLSFLYSINIDIIQNPYRDTQSSSMIGILLLDTFGDYWQRYWFHLDGFFNNQNPGSRGLINLGSVISLLFYFLSITFLIKEQNLLFKKIGILGYIGLFTLIVNAFNLIPFLTKNFNPSKGDPIKTHYFSFLLVFTFIYIFIKIFENKNEVYSLIFLVFMTMFSLQLFNPVTTTQIKNDQTLLNKIHLLSPCAVGDPANIIIGYSHSWCNEEDLILAVCNGPHNEDLVPVKENDYLVFPPDEIYTKRNLVNNSSVITVANYFECINYVTGGFIPQSSNQFFETPEPNSPFIFNTIFLLSLLSISTLCLKKYKEIK